MKRGNILKVATATVLLAVVGTAVYAQDKYSLKSRSGIAFADFRGYEDWAVVSSARTDEVLKVIVANPTMIKAYKAGVPGNGRPFPEGSKIAKLQWSFKKSTEAPFAVDVPDAPTQAFERDRLIAVEPALHHERRSGGTSGVGHWCVLLRSHPFGQPRMN